MRAITQRSKIILDRRKNNSDHTRMNKTQKNPDLDRQLTAKQVREAAGLTYRQLNNWDEKGVLGSSRDKEGSWRRFTYLELFCAMICARIQERFGVSLESLRYVKECMLKEGADQLGWAIETMGVLGVQIFLLTDLETTFMMKSDTDFSGMLNDGMFRTEQPKAYIVLQINSIVNDLLEAIGQEPIMSHNRFYRRVAESRTGTLLTNVETDLVNLFRAKKNQHIALKVEEGQITSAHVEATMMSETDQSIDECDIEDELELNLVSLMPDESSGPNLVLCRRKYVRSEVGEGSS